MNRNDLKKYISHSNISVMQAMSMMDINGDGILFITDEYDSLIASVTDGDVRRWLLHSGDLNTNVDQIMNRRPRYLRMGYSIDPMKYMSEQLITAVPVVDCRNMIIDIIFGRPPQVNNIEYSSALSDISVIVMAGGKGTRLYPYTKILPKPLIPIGDIPILERIFIEFEHNGANNIYVIVNYRRDMIKSYFNDHDKNYKIIFVDEDDPLGTAGGIRLISDKLKKNVLISNCDILIKIDYEDFLNQHITSNNDMTMVTSMKNTRIPYGVVRVKDNGIVSSIEEKPEINYFINTGMYMFKSEYIDWIPMNSFYHMTDLADNMLKNGKKVGMYPISENSFLDMGELEELEKMEKRLTQENLDCNN